MMYSFLGTCKMNNVNYFTWLRDVLERIPEQKASRLEELVPGEWLKSNPKANI